MIINRVSLTGVHCIQNFILSLSMLKIIDFSDMNKKTESFLIQFLLDFLVNSNDDTFAACIARIGSGADRMGIRDGLMVFLKSTMKPLVADKPALKSRVKKMSTYLDRLANLEFDEDREYPLYSNKQIQFLALFIKRDNTPLTNSVVGDELVSKVRITLQPLITASRRITTENKSSAIRRISISTNHEHITLSVKFLHGKEKTSIP